jgi:Amt family ammonium transporter
MEPLSEANMNELNRFSKPHNIVNVVLGLHFSGSAGLGSTALGANLRAVSACVSTHLAACAGGVMGTLLEYIFASRKKGESRKFGIIAFCHGVVAGLVCITPAAEYVSLTFQLSTCRSS